MSETTRTTYTSNLVGSGHYCECGQELTHQEYQSQIYKHKMCGKCMNNYCDHTITGVNYE